MVIPGDVVRHNDADKIVVDVTEDGFAVLRDPGDLELRRPDVVEAAGLQIVGHLEGLPGWTEVSPGEWQADS